MTRALPLALCAALLLGHAGRAAAQEDRNPLEPGAPSAPAAPGEDGNPLLHAPWAGTFTGHGIEVVIAAGDDASSFTGTITVKGRAYEAKGAVRTEDGKTTLEGSLSSGGKDHPFVASLERMDTLVLVSGGTTYTLTRHPPLDAPSGPEGEPATPQEGAPSSTTTSSSVDLSHVRVGQRWVFRLQGGTEMTYTVLEVGPDVVRYEQQAWMDAGQGMQPIREPQSVEFRPTGYPVAARGEGRRDELTVSDIELECIVTEEDGYVTWTAVTGDHATFPSMVRFERGGDVALELVRVEQTP